VRVLVTADDAPEAHRLLAQPDAPTRPLNRFQRWIVRLLGGDR